jgi:hypothetical protein
MPASVPLYGLNHQQSAHLKKSYMTGISWIYIIQIKKLHRFLDIFKNDEHTCISFLFIKQMVIFLI